MINPSPIHDVIIIGAGAAGLMCGIEAAKRGRSVYILDHSKKIGEKIRISGGGRCNFTNIFTAPQNFLSDNPHFCKSALSRYTQHDFIAMVDRHKIAWHEKTLGQLFCDDTAQQIIDMLIKELTENGGNILKEIYIKDIAYINNRYNIKTDQSIFECQSLVIASGGLSIPKIGASAFGYEVAKKFDLNVITPRPALVPLTFSADLLEFCRALSGLSVNARIQCGNIEFAEGLLFTHRGLSGPSILQISSYWHEGQQILINLSPNVTASDFLKQKKISSPKSEIQTICSEVLPKRLAESLCNTCNLSGRIADMPHAALEKLGKMINSWTILPSGTEGYRTAEVTLGGVDTNELSSKTMECLKQPGLYFIGEVVDVTGHLGGFNFQWAWSSGYVAGQYV